MIENIINNTKLIDLYEQVEIYENNDPLAMGYHNFTHALNVMNLMTSIMEQVGICEEDIFDYQVAALLHDIGAYCGKENHHVRSASMASSFIDEYEIKLKDKNRVIEAILNHSSKFDDVDLLSAILIFADKMDMTKKRVAPAGRLDVGMSEFLNVEEISILIDDDYLFVNFITNENCLKNEIENYYFFSKMIKSIESLAKILNLKSKLLFNNEAWIV